MSDLMETILKDVRDKLPETTAGVLKDFVVEANEKQEAFDELSKKYDDLQQRYNNLSDELYKKDEEITRLQNLKMSQDDITRRENEMKVFEAHVKEQASEDKCQKIMELAGLVFRNPTLKFSKNICDTENHMLDYATNTPSSTTKTKNIDGSETIE